MAHIRQTIAVIGTGLAGMACALILARHGHKIVLIERAARPGPALRGFTRRGVHFDTALHYTGGLGEQGPLSTYLRYLGVEGLEPLPFDPACFDEIRFADSGLTVRLPVGYDAMTEALCDRFPADRDAVQAYMREARHVFQSSPFLNLELTTPRQALHATESLDVFLKKRTDNAHLRAALSIHSLLYGVSPEETSFEQHAYIAASYFDAVHTFAGGGRALVAALERRLADAGVEVMCGRAVSGLHCDANGLITEVKLADETRLAADAAIYTGHPAALPDMLPPGVVKPAFIHRLRELRDTASAYMLFGRARNTPACVDGHNLFLCRDPDIAASFNPASCPERHPAEGPLYVASCPHVPPGEASQSGYGLVAMAPGGMEAVRDWAYSTPARRPKAYTEHKEAVLERMRKALSDACPELASMDVLDGATPLTLRDFLHAPGGGLYGCRHALTQFNPLPVTRIPNLWLAGQSILAPGILGVMVSAFLTCGFLVGHGKLAEEVRQCR